MDDDPRSSSLSELRELGLTVDISEREAIKIKADLLIIDGRLRRGHYSESGSAYSPHLSDTYDAIARGVVQANTSDNVLEDMIPEMVERFRLKQQWYPAMTYDTLQRILAGVITEWKGRRLLIKPDVRADHPGKRELTSHNTRCRKRFEPARLATMRVPLFITTSTRAASYGSIEPTCSRLIRWER